MTTPVHRYVDGKFYRPAKGRRMPERRVEDSQNWKRSMAVCDLQVVDISDDEFIEKVFREMRIRCYSANSIGAYRSALKRFLSWAGVGPKQIDREHVREYLDLLACSKMAPNTLGLHLSAIRTAFDKFCFEDVTLGLATPRKPKRLPLILSRQEVRTLLEAAPSIRDTMLLGLMYATGMRVSEVVKLLVRDIDFFRQTILIRQGKGNRDRIVSLPRAYQDLLRGMVFEKKGTEYLFPSQALGKHLSPRTVQRVLISCAEIAGLGKRVTPHCLRHSYATHCFENGYDIRIIQKCLGHARLETTTIYVHVASDQKVSMASPLDQLLDGNLTGREKVHAKGFACGLKVVAGRWKVAGRFRVHCRQFADEDFCRVTLEIVSGEKTNQIDNRQKKVFLTGIRATRITDKSYAIEFPPVEKWKCMLGLLSPLQRERISGPEFYRAVKKSLTVKLSWFGNENPQRQSSFDN